MWQAAMMVLFGGIGAVVAWGLVLGIYWINNHFQFHWTLIQMLVSIVVFCWVLCTAAYFRMNRE
jgi:uncharacterized membrane protein